MLRNVTNTKLDCNTNSLFSAVLRSHCVVVLQEGMVCPVCVATAVSQAAIPVASAVGGAIAARAAVQQKQKARCQQSVKVERPKSSDATLATIPLDGQHDLWDGTQSGKRR